MLFTSNSPGFCCLSFSFFTLLQFYSIVIIILSLSYQNFIAFFTSLHFTFELQYFFFFSQYCHLNCLLLLELKFVFHSIIRDYCMLSFKHLFLDFQFLFVLSFLPFLELSIFTNYFWYHSIIVNFAVYFTQSILPLPLICYLLSFYVFSFVAISTSFKLYSTFPLVSLRFVDLLSFSYFGKIIV